MNTTIEKSELLAILKANRDAHQGIFQEAVRGYRDHALRVLEEHITRIKSGSRERVYVSLPEPEEHTREYDRAIRMVELHTGDTVTLSEADCASYVMDDWAWKRQFLTSNSTYSASAASLMEE